MALKKIVFKPGINREVTNYTNEGGWYDGDKIRFRAGFPEKIGGWAQQSANRFLGACRSLISWITLNGLRLNGLGTNLKYYIEYGNTFYDITPSRATSTVTFSAATGSALITVTDSSPHLAQTGDYVYFSGAKGLSDQVFTTNAGSPWITVATVALVNGQPIQVASTGVLPSPLAANTTYYVRDVAGLSFNLASTAGGTAIAITAAGSGTHSISVQETQRSRTFTASTSGNTISSAVSFTTNEAFTFSSTGTLPAPLQANTTYYALSTGTSTTVALTPGGTLIDITSTGSGTHTVVSRDSVTEGELNINGGYQITVTSPTVFTIGLNVNGIAQDVGNGGGSTTVGYDIETGAEIDTPFSGWGAGTWGAAGWGTGSSSTKELRIWTQANFGEDLLLGYKGSEIYYWDATNGLSSRAVAISSLAGGLDIPSKQNKILVSDSSRFVFCFGVNPIGSAIIDPMLVRWSDQENFLDWRPTATNQSGDLRLSLGSEIVTATQQRQEILVWTDAALYSMQYLGPPFVWSAQIVGENITIMSPNAIASAGNVTYWMGIDKFYRYDGRVQTMRCDVRQFIFQNADPTLNLNLDQAGQVFAGTVEQYDEIWWFYCSSPATTLTAPDRYVVYNYAQDVWYYGSLERTAWLDSRTNSVPIAAYKNRLVLQETGVDDASDGTVQAIDAYISSSELDIGDGESYIFISKVLPDMTFRGSTAGVPSADITLIPLDNSGSGYLSPASVGGTDLVNVVRSATSPIEQYTGQAYVRVRGRQMIFKISSSDTGVAWQLGSPRFDMRPDGRRSKGFNA